jgi:drug/metabolite transporter (DMT)-like permease
MRRTSNLSGVAAMLAATASFVVGDTFRKALTTDLPPFEVLFLRGVAASLACALLLVALGDWRVVSSAVHPRALIRAAGETLSVLCYIVALARLPIADAIAILQTAPLILILAVASFFASVSELRASCLLWSASPAPFWSPSRDQLESRLPPCLPSPPRC